MKFLYILPLGLLAFLGISINSAYYFDSFVNSGYPILFAYSLSAAFMGLEAVLWLYPGKSRRRDVLKGSIIFFSITATLGSQFFSTSELEANIEKVIFQETDTSGDVDFYREQVAILNGRIDEYISQQKIFGTNRNKEALEGAKADLVRYEGLLSSSHSEKKQDIEKINKPMSIYAFYAYRIPAILSGDFGEDSIRVGFQLFSSIILALIAPISLSMIKETEIKRKVKPAPPVEAEPQKQPTDSADKERIAKMLLHFYPDKIFGPEMAVKYFKTPSSIAKGLKAYDMDECKMVYDEIVEHKGKEKREILQEVLG